MKKIKVLYDVVKTMKRMAKIDGVLNIEVQKDQNVIFSLQNQFAKDENGRVTSKVSSKTNISGENLTRESTTEFSSAGDHCPCRMLKAFHKHHDMHRHCGVRGTFHRLALTLGILSSLKLESQSGTTTEISLNVEDIPDELKATLKEKMMLHHACHGDSCCIKDCHDMEIHKGVAVITVNEHHAIDKIELNLDCTAQDADDREHSFSATAKVLFSW